MRFLSKKLEATGRTDLGQKAGAVAVMGGICAGTGEPGVFGADWWVQSCSSRLSAPWEAKSAASVENMVRNHE